MGKFIIDITLDDRERKIEKEAPIIPDIKLENVFKQFCDNIANIRTKFNIFDTLNKEGHNEEAEDILRSQVVFLMSALDFYMHEIVKYCLLQIFKGDRQKTNSYKNVAVSIEVVEKALKNPESVDWLSEDISHRNSHQAFMSSSEIKRILSLISTKKIYNDIENELNMSRQLSNKLEEVYKRRNKIAHQADRDHDTNSLYEINRDDVEAYIILLESVVKVIHNKLVEDI